MQVVLPKKELSMACGLQLLQLWWRRPSDQAMGGWAEHAWPPQCATFCCPSDADFLFPKRYFTFSPALNSPIFSFFPPGVCMSHAVSNYRTDWVFKHSDNHVGYGIFGLSNKQWCYDGINESPNYCNKRCTGEWLNFCFALGDLGTMTYFLNKCWDRISAHVHSHFR